MRTIFPPNKPLRRRYRLPIIAGLALLALILISGRLPARLLGQGVTTIFSPLLLLTNRAAAGFDRLGAYFSSKARLAAENHDLREKIAQLSISNLLRRQTELENEELRAALGRRPATGRYYDARVLNRPNQSPYDTLIIDLGQENSQLPLRLGDPVWVEGEWLIGKIVTIDRRTSRVLLYSSPGQETPVLVGQTEIAAIARGRGGGNFVLELPRSVVVAAGDLVKVTEGERVAPLGLITSIRVTPSDAVQIIHFKSPVNLFELRRVTVYAPTS